MTATVDMTAPAVARQAPLPAAGDAHPAISLAGVSKVYGDDKGGEIVALDRIDLTMPKNAFVSLVGASGCGKSTLLRLISGLIPATTGDIAIDGTTIADYQKGRRFGFVFQDAALLPWKTALENVTLPLKILKQGTAATRRRKAMEMLDLVGLSEFADSYPSQLSGGMRQRVSIARSLVYSPDILLMDEPFGALDEITRLEMNEELLRVWADTKGTIVFVTHSLSEALFLSDRVVVMSARPGRVRAVVDVDTPRPRSPTVRSTLPFVEQVARLEEMIRH